MEEFPYDPLNDYVIVKRIEEGAELPSGLIIPDQFQKEPNRGIVMAVGEGRVVDGKVWPMNIEVGDVVKHTRYGGEDDELDGDRLLILRYAEIKYKLRRKALVTA